MGAIFRAPPRRGARLGPRVRHDVDEALIILLSAHVEGEKIRYGEMFPVLRARGLSTERTVEILQILDLFLDGSAAPV
jgi:hypothetical protein